MAYLSRIETGTDEIFNKVYTKARFVQSTIELCICKIAFWINAQFVNLLTILFFII